MAIKIFIDQGHNPQNPNAGAEGGGLREQDVNYDVGMRLAELLRQNANFEVRLSRNTPDEILGTTTTESLQIRVEEANRWAADYFLSIHCNANNNTNISGSEAYVFRLYSQAYDWGRDLLTALHQSTGLTNRGVMTNPGLYVLRRTRMPAVLMELGYLSNPRDAALLRDDPQSFADGLYQGFLNYFGLN